MKNKKSKRFKKILDTKDMNKKYDNKEIIELVKKNSTAKFDESIDVSLKINLKQSKGGDFNLRTVVNLPNGNGKKIRVAVPVGVAFEKAHKIAEKGKEWTTVSGSVVKAKLVERSKKSLKLKRVDDGREFPLDLKKLSDEDKAFVGRLKWDGEKTMTVPLDALSSEDQNIVNLDQISDKDLVETSDDENKLKNNLKTQVEIN